MGIGIVFWGVAQPIIHYATPPESLNIVPKSMEAVMFSMSTCFLHGAITPYSIYVLCGLGIAYAYYNKGLPFSVGSALYPVLGKKKLEKWGNFVDALTLFAVSGGVAASLGLGVMQLSCGAAYLFDRPWIQNSVIVWFIVTVAVIAIYTISSYTGVNRGLKWLSDLNAKLFFFMLVFVLVFGPTNYIFKASTQALGEYFNNFIPQSLWLSAGVKDDVWPALWPIYYWAIYLAYAPAVGMFLVRLIYGRTIREFIFVNLILPAVFVSIWYAVFGFTAIDMDLNGAGIANIIETKGYDASLYALFTNLPLPNIMVFIALFVCAISFITLADSMTTTVATLSTSGHTIDDPEPPAKMKLIWGFVMGGFAFLGLISGGVNSLKVIGTIAGFSILFLELSIGYCLYKFIFKHMKKIKS